MRVPEVDRTNTSLDLRLERSVQVLVPALELCLQHLLPPFPPEPGLVNGLLVQEGWSAFLRFLHGLVCHTGHNVVSVTEIAQRDGLDWQGVEVLLRTVEGMLLPVSWGDR